MAQQTFEEIVAAVKQAESRGKRYKDDGKTLTTSPKGALGEMQVMPKTILDPGFGVAPAKDKSPDEIARVGVDYLQAMKQKYGDTEKALIAYNWGPGSTDKWIAAGADPKKLPAETRTYVERVKGFLGKDVPRETTVAKKEREPLPASLPPMAEATPAKATVAMASAGGRNMPDIKNMPASYQAAFALAALADAKDDEDDKAYDENKETESEKLMREYKPVNHLASLDLSVTPIMMKDGGDVDAEEKRPDDIKYFSNVNRMKERGTTTDSVMLGARTKAGEGSVMAGLNMANMSRDEKMQTARALMLAYTQQDPEGLGFSANVVKPSNAPAMANLIGSLPVGEGRVSAGMHGNQAYSLGYERPLEGGQFNANLNVPRGAMGSQKMPPQLNLQYNKRFAGGGEAVKSAANDLLKFIDSQGLSVSDVVAAFGKRGLPWSTAFYSGDLNTDEDLELRARRMKNSTIDEPRSGDSGIVRRADGSLEEGERSVKRSFEGEEDLSTPFIGNPNIRKQGEAARRNAAIQKASYRDEVAEAKDTARKGEAYQELERYLQSRDAIPDIKVTSYLPDGTHGLFSSDRTNVGTGTIKVNKNLHETYMPSTIAHEMTHAADRQMMMQAKEQGMFGNGNQFTEAYKKMVGPEGRNRTQLLRKRYPEFEEDNRYYRAEPKELAAHAIGAYSGPAMQDSAPRHVDATAATELRILMDLAQRNVDKGPTGLAKIPAFLRKIVPYADGGEVDMEGQEIKFATGQPQTPVSAPLPPATRNAKELDAYIKALNPGAKISYFPEGGGTLGHVSSDAPDVLNIQRKLSPQRDEETKLHELEHSLTFRAGDPLGRPKIKKVDNNYQAYYMLGDWRPMSQFTQNMADNREKIEQFFGRPLNNAYFQQETLASVKKQQGDTSALFDEQMATLSALEQITGKSLTRDPEMKKLFPSVKVMSVYDALTGPRQTRMDARDLPPSTPQPAYTYRDNAVTQFLHKNLLGDNFYPYKKPVKRADGSPEEGERLTPQQMERIAAQESAEREAASNAAFIAQKSGIGRKAGPVSQALQSGQGQIEFLKGMTNVPQNILGAPMDISNMVASIYGGNVDKPFMGSEYIKEGLRSKGLGFTPSTDPTLAGFYGAGDLGSNLVNPAGVTRAGVQAAGKTGEAARMLAQDFQQYNQNLAVPGASYAVRNKGTPVAMSGLPFLSNVDEAEFLVKGVIGSGKKPLELTDKSLSNWFSKTVTRYLRSDFATPQDQLVRAAEENKMLHLAPKEFSNSAEDQALKHFLGRRQSDLEYMRQAEGFGKSNMATTPYGQRIEDITDISAYPERVEDLTPQRVPASMRNLVETQPEARVTDFAPNIVENLKLEQLRDKMLDVRQSDGKYGAYGQPAVKIPSEFLLPDDTLSKLNVAAASNRMARYTNWQNETRQKMATTALRSDPAFPRAELQEGKFLGVALPDIKKNPEAKQLVIDVGCDGGWCTRYTPNAETYASGFNRLHVIVTGEGKQARPVAQFSVADSGPSYDTKRFSITEIKEKGNTADFANNPALPAIQQYIQHLDKTYGGLDYVDGLKKLRMTALPEYPMQLLDLFNPTVQQRRMLEKKFGSEENGFRAVRDKAVDLNNGSRFMTGNEDKVANFLEQAMKLVAGPKENEARQIQMNFFGLPKEKATGGMIERQPNDNRRYL